MNIVQTVQTKFCDPVLTKFSSIGIWILQSSRIKLRKISIIKMLDFTAVFLSPKLNLMPDVFQIVASNLNVKHDNQIKLNLNPFLKHMASISVKKFNWRNQNMALKLKQGLTI